MKLEPEEIVLDILPVSTDEDDGHAPEPVKESETTRPPEET